MSIAVLCYEKKRTPLRHSGIKTETVSIPELSISVDKITVAFGEKLKRKQKRILEKVYLDYDNVVTDCELLSVYEKHRELKSLMTALPETCLCEYLKEKRMDASKSEFTLIVKKKTVQSKKTAVSLSRKLRFLTLYEDEKSTLSDDILEETGVCVKQGKNFENHKNTVLIIDDDFTIYDCTEGTLYYDVCIEKKDFSDTYGLPIGKILEICVKESNEESYIMRKKVKIVGLKSKKWQLTN